MNKNHDLASVRLKLDQMHEARETALAGTRLVIQLSSKCIKHVHRRQFDEAKSFADQAKHKLSEIKSSLAEQPEIFYHGYVQDSEKEYVEAVATLAIVTGGNVPSYEELNVAPTSFLHGLGEAASECRRTILDHMRHGNMDQAERLFLWMEVVYDELSSFDFPDGLTGGLRRTNDALRAVVERTRSDMTLTLSQKQLQNAIENLSKK